MQFELGLTIISCSQLRMPEQIWRINYKQVRLFINPVIFNTHAYLHTPIHQVVFSLPHGPNVNSLINLDNKSEAGADGNWMELSGLQSN